MKIIDTYFVKLESGAKAWLGTGIQIPDGAELIEVRPMLFADDGKTLHNKITGETTLGVWIKENNINDVWEEIENSNDAEIATE